MKWSSKALLWNVAWAVFVGTVIIGLFCVAMIASGKVDAERLGEATADFVVKAGLSGTAAIWTIAVVSRSAGTPIPPKSPQEGGRRDPMQQPESSNVAGASDVASDDVPVVAPIQTDLPPIPMTIRVAGMLWLIHGMLVFLGLCFEPLPTIVLIILGSAVKPPAADPTRIGFFLLIGGAFLAGGYRAFRGLTPDPLLIIILSAVFGLLYLGMGVVALLVFRNRIPMAWALGLFAIAWGLGLGLAPSLLGLMGRSRYLDRERSRRAFQ